MISVNTLIQQAYEAIGMAGLGESVDSYTDDNLPVTGVNELNRLITQLNNEGYIAMAQKWVDGPCSRFIYFRKLEPGETAERTIDMVPPEKVEGVARKIGERYLVLTNNNAIQMAGKNPSTIATRWTYNTDIEDVPGTDRKRVVGILMLDGDPHNSVRVWYNEKLPKYKLDDTIYLSELYNEVLLSGLAYRLANFFELSEEKKASTGRDFTAAKSLIKQNNLTQRMLQNTVTGGSWRDAYFNGLNGTWLGG